MVYSENILICIAIPLLIALIFIGTDTRRFLISFVTGMVVCLLSAYVSGFFNYLTEIGEKDMVVFYSPVVEEIMKLLPLLFYIFVFEPDPARLFAVSAGLGLGFATFENCCYILSSGASDITYILIRGMAVGVMHLVCALMLVMGLNTALFFKALSISGIVGALSLSMIFHGLYNLLVSEQGVSSYLGYALPVVTAVLLYLPYKKLLRYYCQNEAAAAGGD
ncbi:MAG: PrsW family intramembrane metalloprotease [Lachnospiraceae bacterium]|nr:PrsW family intramembrane metalloprotease [Lachnospiraceae bacterium]